MSADLTTAIPVPRPLTRRRARPGVPLRRIVAWLTAIALVTTGVLLMLNEGVVRDVEARMLVTIANDLFGSDAVLARKDGNPGVAFPADSSWVLIVITIQCAVALYLGPIAFLAGVLALRRGVRLHRVLLSAAAGIIGMMLLNLLRLGLLIFAWSTWGIEAFRWVHGPVGTVLMLVGMAAALVLMTIVAFKRPASDGRRPAKGRRAAQA
ncbi:exosortase R [Leifsonia naganoensis]|uniref:Exosortase/archaeosortase family protein n=1 Tax=Leifsonia naganoensis TaxID=150025 RepID=A0A853DLF8_9MICO|nr:exosortase R [Leifsonia naganoensis]NYK09087.1 exosortase/archaeosortase family protein [Leifsonia naganoensis]